MRSPPFFFALFLFTSAGWAQGLRAVDFANRVWPNTCLGPTRTHQGASRAGRPGAGSFRVDAPVFGDLDGDGVDEAVVRTHCVGGGANHFGDATVFAWRAGRLQEVAYLGLGDSARGPLESLRVERGVVVEERPVDPRDPADADYVVAHRRALRDGQMVEAGPAVVTCRPTHAAGCVPPAERSPEVRFRPGQMAATRPLTFDAHGRLPSLALWVLEGQDLDVDAWCEATAPSLLRVEAPDGPAVENDSAASWVRVHATRAGLFRVSLRARTVAGLCYVRLGVHVLAPESPR